MVIDVREPELFDCKILTKIAVRHRDQLRPARRSVVGVSEGARLKPTRLESRSTLDHLT